MLLAIDAGNTNLVFALVEAGEIKARWRIATDPRRTADEYAVWLHQLLELEGYQRERCRPRSSSARSSRGRCTIWKCFPRNISA